MTQPTLSNAGADTNIEPFTLYPKGSGTVMLNQPEQEPIKFLANGSWFKVYKAKGHCIITLPDELNGQWVALVDATDGKHLRYIAPLRKPWVGLTDEDTANICMQSDVNNWHDEQVIAAVEAKLKELNT